jgi:hypothetical protein
MIMKKTRAYFVLIFFAMIFFVSCEKDYLAKETIDANTPVSYSADIQPIWNEDCAKSGCHATGFHSPILNSDISYEQLTGLGYVDTANADNSILYKSLISTTKPMPPSGKLNDKDISYILAWIKQGAQNN